MYKFLTDNGQLVALGIGALLVLIFFFSSPGESPLVVIPVILIVLCVILMLAFGVFSIVSDPKGSAKGLLGLAVLLVLFFIMYAMADAEATGSLGKTIKKFSISPGVSKYVSASIATTAILGLVAIVAFVVSEVRNFFR